MGEILVLYSAVGQAAPTGCHECPMQLITPQERVWYEGVAAPAAK